MKPRSNPVGVTSANPVRITLLPRSEIRLVVNYTQHARNAFLDVNIVWEVDKSQLRLAKTSAWFFQVVDCTEDGLRSQSFFHEIGACVEYARGETA